MSAFGLLPFLAVACGSPAPLVGRTEALSKGESSWQPGDAVPGWEDANCDQEPGTNVISNVLPSVALAEIHAGVGPDGAPGMRPVLTVADCVDFVCEPEDVTLRPRNAPYSVLESYTNTDGGRYGPGLGWIAAPSVVLNLTFGEAVFGDWWGYHKTGYVDTELSICIARLRPDGLSGVLQLDDAWQATPTYPYSTSIRLPFQVQFSPGSACLLDSCDASRTDYQAFLYEEPDSYDTVWSWDTITDPLIRDTLYNEYYPRSGP